jgi:hypothetical protein
VNLDAGHLGPVELEHPWQLIDASYEHLQKKGVPSQLLQEKGVPSPLSSAKMWNSWHPGFPSQLLQEKGVPSQRGFGHVIQNCHVLFLVVTKDGPP